MQTLDTLVTATDFSPAAEAGLDWARSLARHHGATTHVVHVVPPVPFVPADVPAKAVDPDVLLAGAARRLEELTADWPGAVERHVVGGSPSDAILDRVRESAADAVVLASRGHTGLRYLLLGSTTRRVVQRAPCPVLVVHPEHRRPRVPPGRVLLPTDFEGEAGHAADALSTVFGRSEEGPELVLLHAWEMPPEVIYDGAAPLRAEEEDRIDAELSGRLEEVARLLRERRYRVETAVERGFPTRAIVDQAGVLRADLVVMATHGVGGFEHFLLGSVAERVVQMAPCPVLTFRLPPD